MKMFRTLILFAIALCIVKVSASSEHKSVLSIFGLDPEHEISHEDDSLLDLDESRRGMGEMGAVLFAIKKQFKDIIEELSLQALDYVKNVMYRFKLRLLRKLGMYNLKDVIIAVFEGVTNLFIEFGTNDDYYNNYNYKIDKEREPILDPSIFDGLGLAALYRTKRNVHI